MGKKAEMIRVLDLRLAAAQSQINALEDQLAKHEQRMQQLELQMKGCNVLFESMARDVIMLNKKVGLIEAKE